MVENIVEILKKEHKELQHKKSIDFVLGKIFGNELTGGYIKNNDQLSVAIDGSLNPLSDISVYKVEGNSKVVEWLHFDSSTNPIANENESFVSEQLVIPQKGNLKYHYSELLELEDGYLLTTTTCNLRPSKRFEAVICENAEITVGTIQEEKNKKIAVSVKGNLMSSFFGNKEKGSILFEQIEAQHQGQKIIRHANVNIHLLDEGVHDIYICEETLRKKEHRHLDVYHDFKRVVSSVSEELIKQFPITNGITRTIGENNTTDYLRYSVLCSSKAKSTESFGKKLGKYRTP